MSAPAQQTQPRTAQYALGAAVAARSVQLAIRAALMRDVVTLWPLLDAKRLDQSFPGWVAAMRALILRYFDQSHIAAASFYRAARETATLSAAPADLLTMPAAPAVEWIDRALRFAGPGMIAKDTAQPRTALSTTLGTASRIALEGGRQTIAQAVHNDPVAVGWFRVTDGKPCAFCALMASRGVVYKNERTAGRTANSRFTGEGEFKFHNDCGCSAAPAFSKDQELPELSQTAARIYRERGEGPALVAFRQAWNAHIDPKDA